MKYLIFCLILVAISVQELSGQAYDTGVNADTLGPERRQEMAAEAIRALKDGVLIVRLRTGSNKINAMRKIAENKQNAPDIRSEYEKRIEEEIDEIRIHNEAIRAAFAEQYDFSEVLFVNDTSIHQLLDGAERGYFLNEDLQPDPSITLPQKPYFVAYHGIAASSRQTNVEGLVILDEQLDELIDPFPFFTGMSTMRKTLAKFFNKADERAIYAKLVERFDDQLDNFHSKVTGDQ